MAFLLNATVVMVRNFNLARFRWIILVMLTTTIYCANIRYFITCCILLNLVQYNAVTNNYGRTLDPVLSNANVEALVTQDDFPMVL